MSISPVQFAKEFAKLKSDLAGQPAPDERLLLLIDFWPFLSQKAGQSSYRSYVEEYFTLLTPLAASSNLTDLTGDELKKMRPALNAMAEIGGDDIHDMRILVTQRMAAQDFHVGEVARGIETCSEHLKISDVDLPDEIVGGKNEYEAFIAAHEFLKDKNPELHQFIQPIAREWELFRDAYYHDRIACLFVDKNHRGASGRSRMRILEGSVEPSGKTAASDEVSFDNQVKTPDDPFVGVTYDALAAVRRHFHSLDDKARAKAFYHAHYAIRDSGQTFTGDSIGLAAALVAYTDLLRPEILRSERFLSVEVACTGSIDADGNITEVNPETLQSKIERAFFSPMKYVVMPKANLMQAQTYIDSLRERYPRRRLQVIGVDHLRDAIDNRNILRDEKVCIGEYMGRKTAKYTRSVKVQVPIMLVLAYLLVSVLYPKAWVGFDWNPEYVVRDDEINKITAFNADSIALWTKFYDCNLFLGTNEVAIGDLDGDGKNEVAFIPHALRASPCPDHGHLFVYDDDGDLLFKHDCAVYRQYRGDETGDAYYGGEVRFEEVGDSIVVLTRVTASNPSRSHIRLWTASGDSLGWYINPGTVLVNDKAFSHLDGVGFVFSVINNPVGCAGLLVLPEEDICGVAPPYDRLDKAGFDYIAGNQLHYIAFPPSDLNRVMVYPYNGPHQLIAKLDGTMEVQIREENNKKSGDPSVIFYTLDSNLRIIEAEPDDIFRRCRQLLVNDGELPEVDYRRYCEELCRAVMYWTDSGWVTEGELRDAEAGL